MKFLHTSDLHYGAAPDANRPWGKERAAVLKDAFDRIIRACRRENVDMLIIAGDLFDCLPTEEDIRKVNESFATIPDTRVIILPGKSDALFVSSPVLTYPWQDNVTYVSNRNASGEAVAFPAFYDEASGILAAVCRPEEVELPDRFSYVALGGRHCAEVIRENHMVYSGSPEPVTSADSGTHGYYIGEINDSRELTSLEFISVPTVSYISLQINVTPASTNEEVLRNIRSEINSRGSKNIYTLQLKGMCDPAVTFDLKPLLSEFRIYEVFDRTEPKYDFRQLFKDHPSDMVGFFVKEMNRADISDLDRKALYYGVNALLKTADERSSV